MTVLFFNIFIRQTLTDVFWGVTQKYELRVINFKDSGGEKLL